MPPPSYPMLRELSDQELALCRRVKAVDALGKNPQWQLDLQAIGEEYLELHRAYARLAAPAAETGIRLEALKRLVFLSWYGHELVEPDFFAGLRYVAIALEQTSYALLNTYLAHTAPDPELRWMLAFYSSWADFIPAFTSPDFPALAAFVAGVDHTMLHVPKGQLPPGAMADRGQLGLYWQSLRVEAEGGPAPGE